MKPPAEPNSSSDLPSTPVNLLLAEDDPVSRMLMQEILGKDSRLIVHQASDGAAAWELMQHGPTFDVFVFDLIMPGFNGMELIVRARNDRRLAQVPVVLCSAMNDRETISRAAGLGVRHYVLKPITRADVMKKVNAAIGLTTAYPRAEREASVCARLGLTDPRLVELLQHFYDSIAEWLQACHSAVREQDLSSVLDRANALRGTAVNLGALSLASELTACEMSFARIIQRKTGRAVFLSRSDLDDIESSASRLASELKRLGLKV